MSKTKDYSMTLDEIIEAGEELVASYKKTASTAEIILNAVKELKALFSENSVATTEKPEAKPLPDKTPDKKEAPKEEARTTPSLMCAASWPGSQVRERRRKPEPCLRSSVQSALAM